ncbi:MAG: outer membrane lipid asymmetry maintenance protein MlaD [candidate division NC10 bacterium]|nr:outer membrane lipid asymmetry maintenance protein MlaD [candidate division NC10 bacterium]
MRRLDLEVVVGIFTLAGLICLAFLSIRLGKMEVLGNEGYDLYARLPNTGGLKRGSVVEIAGVEVGRVKAITLDRYQAKLVLRMQSGIQIQEDAILSVKTKGLMGERYVSLSPGGSEKILTPGEWIRETEPPVDLEELLAKYIYGKV